MDTALTEFSSHIEEIAKKAGTEAAREVLEKFKATQKQERKRNLVDVKQLSRETGLSPATIVRHRNSGLIEGFRIGGRVFYDLDQVLSEMKSTRRG
jgi:transcriptional antiterminator